MPLNNLIFFRNIGCIPSCIDRVILGSNSSNHGEVIGDFG
jgi:hypothetical protein